MANIKVAVRIRPFTQREILRKDDVVVRKEGKSVLVIYPKLYEKSKNDVLQKSRKFVVDFCFDANDIVNGSQISVYREIGLEIVNNMFEGYNACVLAYGHSASGKTYTMMGVEKDQGLTPRICQGIFDKLNENNFENVRFNIYVSFLEIYNEKVRDLLVDEDSGVVPESFSLRVREHPKSGPYVQDLTQHLVTEKKKILEYLEIGSRRRSTAATENNISSSRSHAVFTIIFQQTEEKEFEIEKTSKVHLVDLAGSERANFAQTKTRLKEGANINKSLVTLGNVISALADSYETPIFCREHSNHKIWHPFVPYRDSVLTWLLKDTLGGNSNTVMIATVSPASSCFSETINTLRYARRTKRIINQPIVNEDSKSKTIRGLKEEIAKLKALLESFRMDHRYLYRNENLQKSVMDKGYGEGNIDSGLLISDGEELREEKEKEMEKDEFSFGISMANACKISDEKKSYVNGLVNDDLSHEPRFFLGTTQHPSPFSFNNNFGFADVIDFERKKDCVVLLKNSRSDLNLKKKVKECLKRDFSSCENLPKMLNKNRPDLINGICNRFKEELPSSNNQSCTDISSTSQSTSENSINAPASRNNQNFPNKSWSSVSEMESDDFKNKKKNQQKISKATPKQSNVVDAVTARLYSCKEKFDRDQKERKEDGKNCCLVENLENKNICKGTKMKLFDLKRKMAISRNLVKKVDSNTQTDFPKATVRVKEKSVETDRIEGFDLKNPEDNTKKEQKENQSEIKTLEPKSWENNLGQQEKNCDQFTDTYGRESLSSKTNSSQKITPELEESFSDDSLELDKNFCEGNNLRNFKKLRKSRSYEKLCPNLKCESQKVCTSKSLGSVTEFKENESDLLTFKSVAVKIGNLLKNPKKFHTKEGNKNSKDSAINLGITFSNPDLLEITSCGSEKEEQGSSDNSLASSESFDPMSSEETSTEEFIFYKGNDNRNSKNKPELASDRNLYIITENSEQSETSDSYSPRKTQKLYEKSFPEKGKCFISKERQRNQSTRERHPKGTPVCGQQSNKPKTTSKATWRLIKESNPSSNSKKKFGSYEVEPFTQVIPSDSTFLPEFSEKISLSPPDSQRSNPPQLSEEKNKKQKKNYWKDFQSNSQKQFLNFNISGSSRSSSFSVGSQIFKGTSRKDQNTEAEFPSQDSITLVFMGPAKPKTSVLLEIIRKGLNEKSFATRKFASKGVQSDSKLMRSISVDSAMVALSRIAKTQQLPLKLSKTKSVDFFVGPEEDNLFLDQQNLKNFPEPNPACNLNEEHYEGMNVTCSVCGNLIQNCSADFDGKQNSDKVRKTVSWCGNATSKYLNEADETDCQKHKSKKYLLRNSDLKKEDVRPPKVNCLDSELGEKNVKDTDVSAKQNSNFSLNYNPRRVRFFSVRDDHSNSTWPRRRQATGKPPLGTRVRSGLPVPRSPLPPRSPSVRCDDPWLQMKKMCPLNKLEINSPYMEGSKKGFNFPFVIPNANDDYKPFKRPRFSNSISDTNEIESNVDFITDLEADLEESCFRLESAVKRDRIRQEILMNKNVFVEQKEKPSVVSNYIEENLKATAKEKSKPEPLKRFTTLNCIGECKCNSSENQLNLCKHICLKTSHSTFELDSFGPGRNHCHHFCMFCRHKNFEIYHSNPVLNTRCEFDLCRLDFYGYCPCSPIKLPHVSPSPRVYKHHLLKIRKEIVALTTVTEHW